MVNTYFGRVVSSEESGRSVGSSIHTPTLMQDLPSVDCRCLGQDNSLSWGIVLCILGCSTSLNSTHGMLIALLLLIVTTKNASWYCGMFLRAGKENQHWLGSAAFIRVVRSEVEDSQVSICRWRFIIYLWVTCILLSVHKCYVVKFPKALDHLLAAGDFLEINLETVSVWSSSWWFMESVEL